MSRAGFPRAARVRKRREFLAVQSQGARQHLRHTLAFVVCGPEVDERPRLGVTVTRRVGNAVTRNRIKRRYRAAFRLHQDEFARRCVVVCVAKHSARAATFHEIEGDVERLARKTHDLARSAVGSSLHRAAGEHPRALAATRRVGDAGADTRTRTSAGHGSEHGRGGQDDG